MMQGQSPGDFKPIAIVLSLPQLLKERGLTFDSLRNTQHREYSLSGTYRRMVSSSFPLIQRV
jgi:hypothetical protein